MADRTVVIAGAGIAGLTAALSFASKGFSVTVFERAERLEGTGAGLQLSPNATRILRRLGVLEGLAADAVEPEAVILKDARSLTQLARVPLGRGADERWGAPYLVVHRADLQRALLSRAEGTSLITLITGSEVLDASFHSHSVEVEIGSDQAPSRLTCELLVGADGVWSKLRRLTGGGQSRFSGNVAFRAILRRDMPGLEATGRLFPSQAVTAFLAPRFHLVAYPIRGGAEVNLVAILKGADLGRRWATDADHKQLTSAMAGTSPALTSLTATAAPWTAWPLHEMPEDARWTRADGLAMIGDAAHALTPHAAQGAAMAIEDAALLAELAVRAKDRASALAAFESLRRPRIARVARRGRLNRLAWHAAGPAALARNLLLRVRSEGSLAADLDWLYGYDVVDALAP